MTRKKTLEQILKLISSGELPKDLYDKYLSNTPIGFMSFDELEKYFDCNKPTEQEILKKFEELGYEVKINNDNILKLIDDVYDTVLLINKNTKKYKKFYDGVIKIAEFIILQEHQLLTELFRCWGWFDEN